MCGRSEMHKTAFARRQRGMTGQALGTTQKICSRRLSWTSRRAASRYNPKLFFCCWVASNVYQIRLKLFIAVFPQAHKAYLALNTPHAVSDNSCFCRSTATDLHRSCWSKAHNCLRSRHGQGVKHYVDPSLHLVYSWIMAFRSL